MNLSKINGYIKVSRALFDHPIVGFHVPAPRSTGNARPVPPFMAWQWMLQAAAYKVHHVHAKGNPIELERGQLLAGREHLAEAWGWSIQNVRTFLEKLRDHHMIKINHQNRHAAAVVTICNYSVYQDVPSDSSHQTNQQLTSNSPATNHTERKEINNTHLSARKRATRETVDPNSTEMARHSHLHMQLRAKCVKAADGKLNPKLVDALHDDFANVMDLIAEGITADTIVEAITDRCQRLRPQQVSTWGYLVEAIRDFKHRKDNRFNPKKPSAAHDTPEAQFERMLAAHYRGANP